MDKGDGAASPSSSMSSAMAFDTTTRRRNVPDVAPILPRPGSQRTLQPPTHTAGSPSHAHGTLRPGSMRIVPISGGPPPPTAQPHAVTSGLARRLVSLLVIATALLLFSTTTLFGVSQPLHTWHPWTSFRAAAGDLRELFIGESYAESDDPVAASQSHSDVVVPGVILPVSFQVASDAPALAGVLNATTVAEHPGHLSTILKDVFLVGDCIKVVSATECDFELDLTALEIAVHGVYDAGACGEGGTNASACAGGSSSQWTRPRGLLHRLKVRSLWEWSIVGELCSPALRDVGHADVEVFFHGAAKRALLTRGPVAKLGDFALMLLFRRDLFLTQLWIDYWAVMGVGHFYLYFNGPAGAMMEDDTAVARQLLDDPRVTIVQWAFPMWQTGAYRNIGDRPCVGHVSGGSDRQVIRVCVCVGLRGGGDTWAGERRHCLYE